VRTIRRGCSTLQMQIICVLDWQAERVGLVGLRDVGRSHHIRDCVRARKGQQMYSSRRTSNQRHENKQIERTADTSVRNYIVAHYFAFIL